MNSKPVTNTQPESSGLLDEAFDNAIKEAGTASASETRDSELPNLSGDTPGDRVKGIEQMRAFYKEHQQLIDEGIHGAIKVLDSPQLKSLGVSINETLEVGKTNPETIKLAGELAELDAFTPMKVTAAKTGVTTVGIGAALSGNVWLGVEGGGECTIRIEDSSLGFRAWVFVAAGPDVSLSLGVNLSVWWTRPVIGAIAGAFIDLTLKGAYPISVRFSFISEREGIRQEGWKDPSDFAAVALRIGAGKAVQQPPLPTLPVVVGLAGYYGYQWASLPDKPDITKATLTVLDANGQNSIIIGDPPKDMNATLTPPSAPAHTLKPNASSMSIALPNWVDSSKITFSGLTGWSPPQYNAARNNFDFTYVGTQAPWTQMKFVIQNVQGDSAREQTGTVNLIMNIDPDKKGASPTTAPLKLVAEQTSISFNWNIANLPSTFSLVSGQNASGNDVVLYTNAGVLQKMSGVIVATGTTTTQWDLDVLYEFAEDLEGNTYPMVQAIWQQTGKQQVARYQYLGNPEYITSSDPVTSMAGFNNCLVTSSSCPQFQITATPLGSSS
jgi:hypothetical protein